MFENCSSSPHCHLSTAHLVSWSQILRTSGYKEHASCLWSVNTEISEEKGEYWCVRVPVCFQEGPWWGLPHNASSSDYPKIQYLFIRLLWARYHFKHLVYLIHVRIKRLTQFTLIFYSPGVTCTVLLSLQDLVGWSQTLQAPPHLGQPRVCPVACGDLSMPETRST